MHPGLGGRCTYSKRTLSVRLSERGVRLFPITSIELPHRHVQPVIRIQATQIDADALGVGTGPVKALYPACRAEDVPGLAAAEAIRSEEHTSELQSLMRISYAVFCLKKKKTTQTTTDKYTYTHQTNIQTQ